MLKHEMERSSIPNSMLFYGPDGSGKFLTAVELARELNCSEDGKVGCKCASCTGIERLISNDLFILCRSNLRNSFDLWKEFGVSEGNVKYLVRDLRRLLFSLSFDERYNKQISELEGFLGEINTSTVRFDNLFDLVYGLLDHLEGKIITIEMIRRAQRFLSHRSGIGRYRVLIIDGAENMNEEAQNSFLKISEDTPDEALIILTVTSKDRLRSTIVSRCRVYRFVSLETQVQKTIIKDKFHQDILREDYPSLRGLSYDPEIMKNYYDKLASNVDDLATMSEVADAVDGNGHAAGFLEYVLDRLRDRTESLCYGSIDEIYDYENLIKKTSLARGSILYGNANREITLIDFLLHNMADAVKYCPADGSI
jgi:DNA polymerase III delta prime subunit